MSIRCFHLADNLMVGVVSCRVSGYYLLWVGCCGWFGVLLFYLALVIHEVVLVAAGCCLCCLCMYQRSLLRLGCLGVTVMFLSAGEVLLWVILVWMCAWCCSGFGWGLGC